MPSVRFQPIVARTRSIRVPIAPVAHDCVKLIFVRAGSAIVLSEFGERPVCAGDVVALGANTLCGSEPEDLVTVTTLCLDQDYVVDQIFWQHAELLADRFEAHDFTDELYSESAQILRLGEDRARIFTPLLDELVALSVDGPCTESFYRMQALLFGVLDIVSPYVKTSPVRRTSNLRRTGRPGTPRHRRFTPLRDEAREALHLLRDAPADDWTLGRLAAAINLSPSQLGRISGPAYGKTPLTNPTTVRAEHLARLLRETDLPIEAAMREVGWCSRGHAARMFRHAVGVTRTRYRMMIRKRAAA